MATTALTEKELEEYRAAFGVFDKDGSGSISSEELAGILKAQGIDRSVDELKDLMSKYDDNGDGTIDFDEFTRLLTESDIAVAARFARVFKSIDTDGDGSVSAAELRVALEQSGVGVTEEQLQELLKLADTDGNGQLSFEEFLRVVSNK